MTYRFCILLTAICLLPAASHAAKKKKAKTIDPTEIIAAASQAIAAYQPDKALEALDKINTPNPTADSLRTKAERMSSFMQRVDAIQVIDSTNVDRSLFFNAFRLSPQAGTIASALDLPADFCPATESTVYVTEDGAMMLWGATDGLRQSRRFTDGTWEEPSLLSDALNASAIANFPFLMPDGITLYYATQAEDGLGGYDLYVSRRNGEEFPAPQNMGMPYNSPYDDLLLAIDEETGAGWFASDRNTPGGDVTVYTFIPSDTRVNVDIDDPSLPSRARLQSIADTWTDTDAHSSILSAIEAISTDRSSPDLTPDFSFTLPDGRVLTQWAQFKNPQARRVMENYLDCYDELQADLAQLDQLYAKHASGIRTSDGRINLLEKKVMQSRRQILNLSNQIISLEK